ADVLADRHTEPAEGELRRRLERIPLKRSTEMADVTSPLTDEFRDRLRKDRSEPGDCPGRTALETAHDERLRADEDVQPLQEVRLAVLARLGGELTPPRG